VREKSRGLCREEKKGKKSLISRKKRVEQQRKSKSKEGEKKTNAAERQRHTYFHVHDKTGRQAE